MYFDDILDSSGLDLVRFQLRKISGRAQLNLIVFIPRVLWAGKVLIFALEDLLILQVRDGTQYDMRLLLL